MMSLTQHAGMIANVVSHNKQNDTVGSSVNNVKVASFIRLFATQRIICDHMNHVKIENKNLSQSQVMTKLIAVFDNEEIKRTVNNILTRLLNDGIKTYMNKWYNEKQQANIIEMIFNQVILKSFAAQYNELIKCKNRNKNINISHQIQVFNSNDLMSQIFQYLDYGFRFNGDIFNCSLVNTCWLYHCWNINSLYFVDLTDLISQTLIDYNNSIHIENTVTRTWQRLLNVRSINVIFYGDGDDDDDDNDDDHDDGESSGNGLSCMLHKLSLLTNVGKIKGSLCAQDKNAIQMLKVIIESSRKKIIHCDIEVEDLEFMEDENELSPLILPNAKIICIHDLYFYRMWTNKCQELHLSLVTCITKKWCQFLIKNCDCSNIKKLSLYRITFDSQSMNHENEESTLIIKQLASKFTNLNQLKITIDSNTDPNVVLFWQCVAKNNQKQLEYNTDRYVKVDLGVPKLKDSDYNVLNKLIKENNLKIEKLRIVINTRKGFTNDDPSSVFKFIHDQQINIPNCLKHLVIQGCKNVIDIVKQKLMDQGLIKSIGILEIDLDEDDQVPMSDINHFLGLKIIIEKELFVVVDIRLGYSNEDKNMFSSVFDQLCQSIYKLFIKNICVDIKIGIVITTDKTKKEVFDKLFGIYLSYFQSEKFVKGYKEPNCKCSENQSCVWSSRVTPLAYFVIGEAQDSDCIVLKATNVEYL